MTILENSAHSETPVKVMMAWHTLHTVINFIILCYVLFYSRIKHRLTIMMFYALLMVLVGIHGTFGSHFRGGSMSWKKVSDTKVRTQFECWILVLQSKNIYLKNPNPNPNKTTEQKKKITKLTKPKKYIRTNKLIKYVLCVKSTKIRYFWEDIF